jgi:sugar phosphate isomerase/epimerase
MEATSLSLNSATVPSLDVAGLVKLAAANSFGGVGLWRHVYESEGARAAGARIAASGLRVTSVCRAGMFPAATDARRLTIRDDNRRAVDEAHDLGAECLVIVCGGSSDRGLDSARRQVGEGLADLAGYAHAAGVRLAVEPMHPMMIADRSVATSLSEALDLVSPMQDSDVGIALDAYHVFWDVDYPEQVLRASGRLHAVQISDWVLPITHQLRSRGVPGQGSIDLARFLALAGEAGYRGLVEVEVLSDAWNTRAPDEVIDAVLQGVSEL